jgi:hypothetical protein
VIVERQSIFSQPPFGLARKLVVMILVHAAVGRNIKIVAAHWLKFWRCLGWRYGGLAPIAFLGDPKFIRTLKRFELYTRKEVVKPLYYLLGLIEYFYDR